MPLVRHDRGRIPSNATEVASELFPTWLQNETSRAWPLQRSASLIIHKNPHWVRTKMVNEPGTGVGASLPLITCPYGMQV